ncbi:MAG: hypothetical protein KDD55_03585 [Bdellovibrionales bacterium]|nr:hypothetical protein [Bdellovibrionales bacterium]
MTSVDQCNPHSSSYTTVFFVSCLLLLLTVSQHAHALPGKRQSPGKALYSSDLSDSNNVYSFDLNSSLDSLLITGSDTNLYDPLTIKTLTRLKEQSFPYWSGDSEPDPGRTRRIVEKAFTLESFRNLSQTIQKSELKDFYFALKQGLNTIRETFRFSLQRSGSEVFVSRQTKGEKLLELNVEFNASKGIDPQLAFGDHLRFRYDYIRQRPMLEVGFDF